MAALGAAGVLSAVTAIAMAQGPPPTVAVTASPNSVAAQVPGPIPAGPTTFRTTRTASGEGLTVYFALLNAGVSLEELQAALRRDDRTRGDSSLGLVSIQASVSLEGGETTRDVTFTLEPGLTYVMLSEEQTEDEPPSTRGFGAFTTSGTPNGATLAEPDATIRMVGRRFRGDRVLSRNGVVRFTNEDGVPHFAVAFPLRPGVGQARFGRALRASSERAFGRVIAGAPISAQGLISGGGTANDQQVRFPRAGRYGFVCFFDSHERQGMYRVITVR
jgi:uncharacterized cupredoxin-like copper-binding protein